MNQAIRISLLVFALLLQACDDKIQSPTIKFANHKAIAQTELQGKWLVINYWAVWCKPCIEEIPELNALNQEDGVQVLGVNFDQPDTQTNLAAIEKLNVNFPVSETNLQTLYHYQMPQALPTTIIISPEGLVKHELTGPQTKEGLLKIIYPENNTASSLKFKGTLQTNEETTLPEGTVIQLRLYDVSKQDVKATLVKEKIIENAKSLPANFSFGVAQNALKPKNLYNLRAKVILDEKLIWTSTQALNPLTAKKPEQLVIKLQAVD